MARQGDLNVHRLTVDDLALLYMEHVREHYRKDGQPTTEVSCIRIALRHLIELHGRTRAREFGPKALNEVRQAMIDAGYVRSSINIHVGRIRRLFRWAAENEYVSAAVWQALCAVSGLREGRSKAKEAEPVKPVSRAAVDAVKP